VFKLQDITASSLRYQRIGPLPPCCGVEELSGDKRPFARVMYAGRLSLESGDDVTLREKYAWEILNTTGKQEYDIR
jgi:hypothetical protein